MGLLTTAVAISLVGGAGPQSQPFPYKVLYAGTPGSVRAQAFPEFFKSTFVQTGTTDIAKFDGSQAKGYDLVFLDFRSGKTERMKLPSTYKTPTVVVGWQGVFMVDEGRTKGSNYWWECGTNQVQGEPGNHEIFKTPFMIKPKMESIQTPSHYSSYEAHMKSGKQLPDTLPVWIAQNRVEDTPSVVTAPYSFKNGGDAEALVMAINTSKGIDSPVVWRRENYLVWGFYGMPAQYTEDGRKLFLNCLVYMAKRGQAK